MTPDRRVRRQRLRARVEDCAVAGRPAHDGRDHAKRTVLERHGAIGDARAIAVYVRSDAHLVDLADLVGPPGRRRPTAADPLDGETCTLRALARRPQPRAALGHRRIGHEPGEAETIEAGHDLSEVDGLLGRLDAGAPEARVALDQEIHLQALPCEHARERRRGRSGVADDAHRHATGERREPLRLGGADEREAEQDVVEAGVGHHLGLTQLLACDPVRAGIDLEPCEARQLVRLDVRPERERVLVAVALHAGDVPPDGVEVDGQHRRLEVGEPRHPVAPADTAPLRTAAVAPAALAAIRSSSASECGASRPTSSLPRAITLAPASR